MTPEIIHTLSIIATVVATGYYIHRDIKEDMKTQSENLDRQSARTDRLYEMFIDLLKDRK
jgi:DNA-binding winged helix-turn-helix (wHTH) protein